MNWKRVLNFSFLLCILAITLILLYGHIKGQLDSYQFLTMMNSIMLVLMFTGKMRYAYEASKDA